MRTIQEIFNEAMPWYHADAGMCYALVDATGHGRIDKEERDFALQAVNAYVRRLRVSDPSRPSTTWYLRVALWRRGLPSTPEDCEAIYRDWERRPMEGWTDEAYIYPDDESYEEPPAWKSDDYIRVRYHSAEPPKYRDALNFEKANGVYYETI